MPCDSCRPDYYDYGFELNDERAVLFIREPCSECNPDAKEYVDEGCEACNSTGWDFEHHAKLTIRIQRNWRPCECGEGTDYDCTFVVAKDGKDECWFDAEDKAHTWISIQYPNAAAPEPDPDWESERWLRRAEGWG